MEQQFFCIGFITEPHGIAGEVKVFPTTDDVDRFGKIKEMKAHRGKEEIILHPERCRKQNDRLIVKFKEIHDRNESELFRKTELFIKREDAVELDENEYYAGDIIGMDVYAEDGSKIGKLTEIYRTGANDVYQIKRDDNGKEILLPAIEECILEVDTASGRMTVHIMDGLE